jgi:hypothetical protein
MLTLGSPQPNRPSTRVKGFNDVWNMVCTKVALASVACGLVAAPAGAQGTGLDSLHAQVRVGNKMCMVDHFHNGASSGATSRKQAEVQAIASWVGFTAWEYGGNWGSWRLAETKRVNCDHAGGRWSCSLEARPCKSASERMARRPGT